MLAVTAGDELVSTKNERSHDVRPGKIEANQIMHQMKKEARQQIVPVNSSIIATCLQEVTDENSGVMDPERILIFGDRDKVHALRVHNSRWLCDVTFKV